MKYKICCVSDTHLSHNNIEIPECDLLIHSGDFSYVGKMVDIIEVNQWFGKLKRKGICKQIIAVAGNHDWVAEKNPSWTKEAFTNCIYLNEESADVFGFKVFGSPITPEFNNWAFNRQRGQQIARNWAKIPEDTEILITHGPSYGILDVNIDKLYSSHVGPEHLGCEELKKRVDELINLKLHVFGHIHSSNAQYVDEKGRVFVNASIMNESYEPIQSVQTVYLEKTH